jgi:hypothetical protein
MGRMAAMSQEPDKEAVMNRKIFIMVALMIAVSSVSWAAGVPRTLNYQGMLTQSDGKTPVADGQYGLMFRLYASPSAPDTLWSESHAAVPVSNGLFNVILGSKHLLDVPFDGPYWLGISVGNAPELLPRIQLTAVAYAFRAAVADSLRGGQVSNGGWIDDGAAVRLATETDNVGIGVSSPEAQLHIRGGAWDLTHSEGDFKIGDETYRLKMGVARAGNGAGDARIRAQGGTNRLYLGVGDRDLIELKYGGVIRKFVFYGEDFWISAGGDRGAGGRALVHGGGNSLVINYNGDFTGGTQVQGSGLTVTGTTKTKILTITGGSDIAEPFPAIDMGDLEPGCAVVIDAENPGHIELSSEPYDRKVVGIMSGAGGVNPGLMLRQEGKMDEGYNVALCGRVYAFATAANGSIKPGDLLTTSAEPGHIMKATDYKRAQGAIVGKAMSSLESGEGLVLVLVNIQ